jgi:hypothetical protein
VIILSIVNSIGIILLALSLLNVESIIRELGQKIAKLDDAVRADREGER